MIQNGFLQTSKWIFFLNFKFGKKGIGELGMLFQNLHPICLRELLTLIHVTNYLCIQEWRASRGSY
jgi:hypothetical protein